MAEFPTLTLWTDAYLGDTQHLTLEEHGAYLKLLFIAWRTPDCDLPDDDRRLANMLGVGLKKWSGLKLAVMAFWHLEAGRWTQKRLTRERDFVRRQSQKNRDAANARWNAKPLANNNTLDATALLTHIPKPSPHTHTLVSKQEVVLRELSTSSTLVSGETDFDEWYKLYPRKKARLAAERAYKTARKRASRETLLEALKRYIAECAGAEQQHIAHPATWLNAGRWLDEGAAPTLAFDPNKAERERLLWLREYAVDGRWPENTGNGLWTDAHGVGPPPHDSATRVTEADLARFPKARAMRDKLKGAPRA